jgi:ferric-dicitrate binding protein FerR (iron transport regulator)
VSNDHNPEQELEQAWREWAARPPQRPPEIAAQRVVATLRERRRRHPWRWLLATATAAAVVLAMLAGSWYLRGPDQAVLTGSRLQTPSLADGQVLIWLDDTTPLYMTFQMPETSNGTGGDS